MAHLDPYLNFNGNAYEVFSFYKSVFGGEFQTVMQNKDVPAEYQKMVDSDDFVWHIALEIAPGNYLMGSDTPNTMGKTTSGTNFSISINADSKEEADRLFKALSAGGTTVMPMDQAFWGSYFGMLNDKFGIQWMVSFGDEKK